MGYYSLSNRKRKILGYKSKNQAKQGCTAKRITEIFSSNFLEDKRCFLLGGGPSLRNFDYSLLENELVIGVNKSFLKFNTNICYCMDLRLYDYISHNGENPEQSEIHNHWMNYKGVKVFLCPRRGYKFSDDIYVVERIEEKCINLDVKQGIYPGSNSGFGALMLAIALGCKNIALLGYSMKIGANRRTHWHSGYAKQEPETFAKKLEKFKRLFEEFAPSIKKEGIEVTNLDLDSALSCFPKKSLEDFLKEELEVCENLG